MQSGCGFVSSTAADDDVDDNALSTIPIRK